MKRRLLGLVIPALMMASGCSRGGDLGLVSARYAAESTAEEYALDEDMAADEGAEPMQVERKIIRTGRISFESGDPAKTHKLIEETAAQMDGWLSQDDAREYDGGMRYEMTIRVPASKFDALLDKIAGSVEKLDSKSISAQDVTDEFIDLSARLKTKKELEARYREILKRANSVEEILAVEKQIGDLRSDIESVEGRLKFITEQVSFSTLSVVFYQKGVRSFGFGSAVGSGIKSGWHALLYFIIGLVNVWPFLLIGGGAAWLIVRARRRRKLRMQGEGK